MFQLTHECTPATWVWGSVTPTLITYTHTHTHTLCALRLSILYALLLCRLPLTSEPVRSPSENHLVTYWEKNETFFDLWLLEGCHLGVCNVYFVIFHGFHISILLQLLRWGTKVHMSCSYKSLVALQLNKVTWPRSVVTNLQPGWGWGGVGGGLSVRF